MSKPKTALLLTVLVRVHVSRRGLPDVAASCVDYEFECVGEAGRRSLAPLQRETTTVDGDKR